MKKINISFKALGKQALIILLYFIITILLQVLLYNYLLSSNNFISGITYLFIELITLLIFIIIFKNILIPDLLDFKNNGLKYIKSTYKYWLYGLIAMVISNVIISSFIGLPSNEAGNREILEALPIYSIISMVICAPIIEEAMTRAILKDKVKPDILYYSLSGGIFGGMHLLAATNINEIFFIIPYGALGFAFAVIYNKSNNIWTNIFFHMLHNGIAVLLIILTGA